MVKTLCIIQARLTSSRLPNKVLTPLGNSGLSILEHTYLRLKNAVLIDEIIFAIPDSNTNDKLATFLTEKNIPFHRDSETDVLKRFYNAAIKYDPTIVLRATCDNPCVDWELADKLIQNIGKYDYTYCNDAPLGVSVEVMKFSALEKAFFNATTNEYREHVTPYIYKNPSLFSTTNLAYDIKTEHFRLTVDTVEDLSLMNNVYTKLYTDSPIKNKDIYTYLKSAPEVCKINSEIVQNKISK